MTCVEKSSVRVWSCPSESRLMLEQVGIIIFWPDQVENRSWSNFTLPGSVALGQTTHIWNVILLFHFTKFFTFIYTRRTPWKCTVCLCLKSWSIWMVLQRRSYDFISKPWFSIMIVWPGEFNRIPILNRSRLQSFVTLFDPCLPVSNFLVNSISSTRYLKNLEPSRTTSWLEPVPSLKRYISFAQICLLCVYWMIPFKGDVTAMRGMPSTMYLLSVFLVWNSQASPSPCSALLSPICPVQLARQWRPLGHFPPRSPRHPHRTSEDLAPWSMIWPTRWTWCSFLLVCLRSLRYCINFKSCSHNKCNYVTSEAVFPMGIRFSSVSVDSHESQRSRNSEQRDWGMSRIKLPTLTRHTPETSWFNHVWFVPHIIPYRDEAKKEKRLCFFFDLLPYATGPWGVHVELLGFFNSSSMRGWVPPLCDRSFWLIWWTWIYSRGAGM